jgi:hypothetical protein
VSTATVVAEDRAFDPLEPAGAAGLFAVATAAAGIGVLIAAPITSAPGWRKACSRASSATRGCGSRAIWR